VVEQQVLKMRNELVIAEEKIYEVRWDCSEGLVVPVLDDLDIIPMSPIIFILPPLLLPLPDSEERFLRPRVAPEAPPNAKSAIKMGDLMLLVCAGKTVVFAEDHGTHARFHAHICTIRNHST
jgi:hypothetical protein